MIKNSLEVPSKEFFHIFFPTDSWKKQKKKRKGKEALPLFSWRWKEGVRGFILESILWNDGMPAAQK
jgi:hypothetical protein